MDPLSQLKQYSPRSNATYDSVLCIQIAVAPRKVLTRYDLQYNLCYLKI